MHASISTSNPSTLIPTKNTLPEKIRAQVTSLLQERLADSVNLYLQLKQAHWNVKGAEFISVHLLFDKVAAESNEHSDLIAERIAQLGGAAHGTLESVTRGTALPKYPISAITVKEHVAALSRALATYGELTRNSIRQVVSLDDPASADVLTEILRGTDKNLWMIEAHAHGATETYTPRYTL